VLGVSSSSNSFVGIGLFESARGLVRDSSGSGSTDRQDGVGMVLFQSHHTQIVHNAFRHNAHVGIVSPESNRSLMERNLFSRNDDEAILVEGGNRNQVTRNRFVRNGSGITLGPGSRNTIDHNRISGGRDGIRVEKGHKNLIAENVVVDARHVGITLGIHNPFIGGARNVVLGNVVRRSRVDGFVVLRKDAHSLLWGNIARGAGDDGFDVGSRSATLTGNRAVRNDDLGIEAVFGVIDGGRNSAHGNGNPLQCTNIACS
jgi:parallel beta-helix repeat protein